MNLRKYDLISFGLEKNRPVLATDIGIVNNTLCANIETFGKGF